MVLDCFNALGDEKLSEDYRVLASLIIFYNELNSLEDVYTYADYLTDLTKDMYNFFNCGQEDWGASAGASVIDWDKDAQMICSAVNHVAGHEVRRPEYLHWWTFLGYYGAVGESTLATVVSIRYKIVKGHKLEKWEQKFKRENPDYFVWKRTSVADREAEDLIRNLWNKGGES
jgi:hypothetical protein